MWIHSPIVTPHLSNVNSIDFHTHIMAQVWTTEWGFAMKTTFHSQGTECIAISFNIWWPILETFSGSNQQRGWVMSRPVSRSFSIERPFHSHLLNCQVSPINPDLALHSCSMTELFNNKDCSVSTESQPAVRMQDCFGHFLLFLFALDFPHPQRVPFSPSVNIYTAISILCPVLFSADM